MTPMERGNLARARTPGPTLYFACCKPDKPVAMVAMVHGYFEHGGRYEHVQRAWADRGLASVIIDFRGHGRSEGARGACKRFSEYHDDTDELFALAEQRADGLPIVLFAHSFGGLVAASYTLESSRKPERTEGSVANEKKPGPHEALVLSDPYFRTQVQVPKAKLVAARITSKLVPFLSIPAHLEGKDLTHDPERIKAHDEDPLVFGNANSRWFMETQHEQERTLASARRFEMPLYMVLGLADPIVAPSGGKEFFEGVSSKDKKLEEHPGLFHEVLNEPEWESIAGAMADWMLAHTK